jgi:hypothetical protein
MPDALQSLPMPLAERQRDHVMDGEQDDAGAENPTWGYGRQVLRRPEARSSEVAKANVIHTAEESRGLSMILAASIRRRRALSDERLEQQLDYLAVREAQQRQADAS